MPGTLIPAVLRSALGSGDILALAVLALAWAGMGWLTEHPPKGRPSVTVLMAGVRRQWMREFLRRENRIFDTQIMSSLQQVTAFFASTAVLAVGGVLALIGNTSPLTGLAEEIGRQASPSLLWQIRLLPAALLLTHAFLKFVWANRVFGYCAIVLGSVPEDPTDPRGAPRAARAAELNIRAGMNFNRGLRSMYFALASLAWVLGDVALVLAVLAITGFLAIREFASVPHDILAEE